jgi:hypothetical protein
MLRRGCFWTKRRISSRETLFRKFRDIAIIPKRRKVKLALIQATRDLPGYNWLTGLGLGYLKSYLRMQLPQVDVIIYDNIDSVIQGRPDCVGVSASTEDFAVAQRYVKHVQEELGCPVLLGGVHISEVDPFIRTG